MRFVGIDPSTKTGVAIIDAQGNLIDGLEITSKAKDPVRMIEIIDKVIEQLEPNDIITIEGFAYGAQGNAVSIQYGLGWALRMRLHEHSGYTEIAPTALKKFASGKGNTKKDELSVHIYKAWGFEHKSDNVRDAYVLARMALGLHQTTGQFSLGDYHKYQLEVLETVRKGK
ncbi:MAG: hypothetical protein NAG76_22285 [Candidatus Pristimantibacillus lignocellulolyticus]|uniref:Holliday junction nuclease RuvC n=1 Tax=Candidatus Pristimantibacillus lignocellulolyticus TaxID=2994561 RepID=A0A9J6ZEQ1_9BACL|nr:MAG: hypothetical protein NAG76_22285 [Candidatus Pristimantibacillus lignocellulolyticus]